MLYVLLGMTTTKKKLLFTEKEKNKERIITTKVMMGVLVVEPFKRLNFVHQGFILKFKFIFLPPPPHFLISIFSQLKFIIMRVCEPQAKNCLPFFCNFVYFKSIGEKICIIFTNWGKKYAFPPLFLSPFNYSYTP